jgi:hypothetical protein
MKSNEAVTVEAGTNPDTRDECMACGHPSDRHDRIARRYCDATISGVLTRGCVCPAP